MYPLGGVFCRRGAAKLVEQGASYSEGYMRYPNGFRQSAFLVFPFDAAKVLQKREATKKVTSRDRGILGFSNRGSNRTPHIAKTSALLLSLAKVLRLPVGGNAWYGPR